MDENKLAAKFPREDIHWRVQGTPYERNGSFSAMALAYIDARDVMDRLDEVCGPSGWQDKYEITPSGVIICSIGIRFGEDWVWKSDGAGETAVEGKKGGMSDALKRCAVKWGIGRYLYRLDSPWVKCEVSQKNGKTYWKKAKTPSGWLEDPWSKVKSLPYHAAEGSLNDGLQDAAINAAIRMIETEKDLEDLAAYWADLDKNDKPTSSDQRVIAAKDKRKAELQQVPA